MGTEENDETTKNIIADLKVINGAYKETKQSPMCCFRYDSQQNIICDIIGPFKHQQFMEKCKECQTQIKTVLCNLKID